MNLELLYKSVSNDIFIKILDNVRDIKETEKNKRLYYSILEEFKYYNKSFCPCCDNKYIQNRFNLNRVYQSLQLGNKCIDYTINYKYDNEYFTGLDFLLNKCNVFCVVDLVNEEIIFSYELKDKNIKYRKSYEEYGYENEEDFFDLEEEKNIEFIYNDKYCITYHIYDYLEEKLDSRIYEIDIDINDFTDDFDLYNELRKVKELTIY